jgi:hypothetical protein
VHERIQSISHQGKQVLLVDLSNCSAVAVEKIVRAVSDYVTAQLGSVLLLVDFTGASFNQEGLSAMKRIRGLRQTQDQEVDMGRSMHSRPGWIIFLVNTESQVSNTSPHLVHPMRCHSPQIAQLGGYPVKGSSYQQNHQVI